MPDSIVVVTGERGSGKTAKMIELADLHKKANSAPAGIVSINPLLPGTATPDKTLYEAWDVGSGRSMVLASEKPFPGGEQIRYKRFYFSVQAFLWASSVIRDGFRDPVLFIDELGPVELDKQGFYAAAKDAVDNYTGLLILAIRKELVADMSSVLGIAGAEIVDCGESRFS